MKRFFVAALAAISSVAFAVTTVPVQLLNTSGSTAGQAVVSTGPSSAATWGNVSASTLTGVTQYDVAVGGSPGLTFIGLGSSGTLFASNGAAAYPSFRSLASLGIAASGANGDITSLTGLTTPLGTWAGGLGANNSAASGVPVFSSGTATVTSTTGTGSPVLATAPTITTPTIVGITDGSAAAAGSVGEPRAPTNLSTQPMTSGTALNLSSVSLTAGDWEVHGYIQTVGASGTVTTSAACALNTTSATLPGTPNETFNSAMSLTTATVTTMCPWKTINVTSTTTVYLVGYSTFTTSTQTGSGVIDYIRRVR